MKFLISYFFIILCWIMTSSSIAGPWLYSGPYPPYGSMGLKSDIDLLADYGFIKAPVLTWPIAWVNIGPDMQSEDSKQLFKTAPPHIQMAYNRILQQYKLAQSTELEGTPYISGGSNINPFRVFEWQPRSDFEAGIAFAKQSDKFAAQVAVNYGKYDDLTHDMHLDNSYFYMFLGNWALGVDKLNRWWSPAFTDSMILSANAPPLPTLTLQRMQAQAFETKWLRWLGPWSLTTSLSVGGNDVPIKNPLIWLMNIAFRPLPSLQFSVSRVAFFAGETRPLNGKMLWNLLIVNDNCSPARDGKEYCDRYTPGTEHWETTIDWNMQQTFAIPAKLYLQTIYNDRVPHSSAPWLYLGFRPPVPGRTAFLAGGNTWTSINKALVRLYAEFEYTYQYVYYFWGEFAPNIYGYSNYPYVYYGKILGSALGNESIGYSVGGIINENNGSTDTFMLRYLNLNAYNYQGIGYPFPQQKVLWFSVGKTTYLPRRLGQLSGQLGYLKTLEGAQGISSGPSFFLVWNRRL